MNILNEALDLYLRSKTNHAILINGEWGAGKTHYFKNTLVSMIKDIPVYGRESKRYKTIHVSLFGISSLEDVYTEVLSSLYPILNNKTLNIVKGTSKLIIKTFLTVKNLDPSIIDGIRINKKSLVSLDEIVLCFDDIERRSPNFDLSELIGFINNLVENEGVKVLIIANEPKIECDSYKDFKEKIIGEVVEFWPDISIIYDSICFSNFSSFSAYRKFLTTNKNVILSIFEKHGQRNLRTLLFILNRLQYIFSELENRVKSVKGLELKKNEIAKDIIAFATAISIEFKKNVISFKDNKGLENEPLPDWFDNIYNNPPRKIQEKETEEKYNVTFAKNYFGGEYKFFKSIYGFLTGGGYMNGELLIDELKSLYRIEDGETPIHYLVYNRRIRPTKYILIPYNSGGRAL